MFYRLVSGSVAVVSLLAVLVGDVWIGENASGSERLATLLRHGSLIPLAFTALIVLAVRELATLLRAADLRPHVGLATVACVILMLSPWLCAGRMLGDSPVDVEGLHWQLVWLATAVFATLIAQLIRRQTRTAAADIGATWLMILYLGLLPSFALQLRCAVNITDSAIGVSLLLIVLAIALAADVGAYYVGSAIGRHRLAPWVSPGKTVEGFFGGLVASITVAIAFWLVAEGSVPGSDSVAETGGILSRIGEQLSPVIGRLSFLQVFVFGLVTSVCAQMGDLFESLLKRSAQVKDSSGVIPGMGGVLDVIDGLIFAAPAAWFLMTFVWEVV